MNGAAEDADAATFARALLPRALAAFSAVAPPEREPALTALDRFLQAPGPANFLAAARVLDESRRAAALAKNGRTTIERLFAEGASRLQAVPGLSPEIVAEITRHMPIDPRAGRRLAALADLVGSYGELLGRVAHDTEEMRGRMRAGARRSAAARRDHPRKR